MSRVQDRRQWYEQSRLVAFGELTLKNWPVHGMSQKIFPRKGDIDLDLKQ